MASVWSRYVTTLKIASIGFDFLEEKRKQIKATEKLLNKHYIQCLEIKSLGKNVGTGSTTKRWP